MSMANGEVEHTQQGKTTAAERFGLYASSAPHFNLSKTPSPSTTNLAVMRRQVIAHTC
jgi:hypothetical protein